MRISEAEAIRRLGSSRNLVNLTSSPEAHTEAVIDPRPPSQIDHQTIKRGRGDAKEVPEFLRDTIGALATMPGHETTRDIAKQFGISHKSVSNYGTGRVGGKPATAERAEKVADRMGVVKDTALTKLMGALNLCTEEKLVDLSAKELGRFANDMSRVITSVSPAAQTGQQVNFILYSPEQKSEEKYKTIDI
jgi:hypothetical protein